MEKHDPMERIEKAVDARLSGLQGDPWLARRVMAQAKGECKMKKKASAGLILVIVLVLAAVTALAASLLWQQQVVSMKEIERTEGDFAHWPVEKKSELIQALIAAGSIKEDEETARFFAASTDEKKKNEIADQLVLTLTGQTDIQEVNTDVITYAVMGAEDTWTPEQRVWWQQITRQFSGGSGNPDTLVTPHARVLSEEEAVRIAKEAILSAYRLPANALDQALPVANLYVTQQRPDYQRWDVQFKLFKEGTTDFLEKVYSAVVDENGDVIADPDVNMPSLEERAAQAASHSGPELEAIIQAYRTFADQANGAPFQSWPTALKSAYSKEVRPMVLDALADGRMNAYGASSSPEEKEIIASTVCLYGMPDENDLTEEEACQKAAQALWEHYNVDAEAFLFTFSYFDITDANAPTWRFVFLPHTRPDTAPHFLYRIELSADTGEERNSEKIEVQQALESLDYDLKLH